MTTTGPKLPFVHAVTNSAAVRRKDFLETAERIMRVLGPMGAVHLRSSEISGRQFYELASVLVELQKQTECWLVVNDRVDVAAAVGARGIQLAQVRLTSEKVHSPSRRAT